MSMHLETAAWFVAGGMMSVLRSAATVASDRRAQATANAWGQELAAAHGNANAMAQVAAAAVRQIGVLEDENESLVDEVARLRALLAQRNELIRSLTA